MTHVTTKDDAGRFCVPAFVNGEPVWQESETSYSVVSAAKSQVAHYAQSSTPALGNKAVEAAQEAFKAYRKTTIEERRKMLLKAADNLESRREESVALQVLETSADKGWAQYDNYGGAAYIRAAAAGMEAAISGDLPPSSAGNTVLALKEPVGPVLLITPWNAAIILCARGIAAALAAGCTVVLKASELCPATHALIVQAFHDAGFPKGAINMVTADRSVGPALTEALISHTSIRKVEFVGSAAVGRLVGAVCAKYLKPIIMELGDQSPLIVLDDADLEAAARDAIQASNFAHGQACFGVERVIVQQSVHDDFVQALSKIAKEYPSAGTAVTKAAAEKSQKIVQEAVQHGASFIYGSAEMLGPASLHPSALANVSPDSMLSKDEAFAPTMFLTAVQTQEDAIVEANSRDGGLAAAVYTKDHQRGLQVAKELEFGNVAINAVPGTLEFIGPLAARKASGWGTQSGRYGVESFLTSKTIHIPSAA